MQWSRKLFDEMCRKTLMGAPITNLEINYDFNARQGLRCSSISVTNELWDAIISEIQKNEYDEPLEVLQITQLQEWSYTIDGLLLQQLAMKAQEVKELTIQNLVSSEENN